MRPSESPNGRSGGCGNTLSPAHSPLKDCAPHPMADAPSNLTAAIYAKTAQGQQEIQSRSLGLTPLARRVLVLVDGKRSGQDLSTFVPGGDITAQLTELLGRDCIEAVGVVQQAPSPAAAPAKPHAPDEHDLAGLPPAESRSAKELEMARNFMTNTVNNIFGHHNRISLLEAIHGCQSSGELRHVYVAWAQALETNATGKKRLPELREKLFAVL